MCNNMYELKNFFAKWKKWKSHCVIPLENTHYMILFTQNQENTYLINSDRKQISGCEGLEMGMERLGQFIGKNKRGTFGMMKIFYILIVVVAIQLYMLVKPYTTVLLKMIVFYLCKYNSIKLIKKQWFHFWESTLWK